MRRVSRSLVVLAVVFALALPVHARPSNEPREKNPVVKLIKKLLLDTFGDGLTTPRP